MANPMTGYKFNGSNDPVYQETMEREAEKVARALELLREAFHVLDSAEETMQEAEALAGAMEKVEMVGLDHFDLD